MEEVASGVWIERQPLSFMGVRLGSRMTVVRLDDGGLWVHSPVALTPSLRDEVAELGEVRSVVAPNLYHHLHAGEWVAAHPGAKLFGVAGLAKKRKDLRFDRELGDSPEPEWEGQLEQQPIRGSLLGEAVFFHPSSRTLITADLTENFQTSDHWFTRGYLKLSGIHGKPGLSRMLRPMFRDRTATRESLNRVLEWDFARVVISHGDDILRDDARGIVERTYDWL